ncbi:kinase-like domain-containing protein [Mycena leptocephala]|nr:kinase-like domain-containing protein [Mycena leptocephala]
MLAMMAFKETEDCYYVDLEKLIKYHDPRNHLKYQDFSWGIDKLFEKADDIRNLSEALLRGLQEATSEYQAHATYLGDMLLATIPQLLQLYQAYIEALPAALSHHDLENPQDLGWGGKLSSILNLLPLPLLRLRHYPDSLASLIRLVQSSNNDLDKSDLVTLICALSLMKELVNTINSSAVNVEQHLTILLSEEFASKVEFSHPQPLRAAMVYTGRDYPEIMLLRLTFLHSEWMYSKDLDGLMRYLDELMSLNEFSAKDIGLNEISAKDIRMVSANVKELQTLSQTLHHHTSDQNFIENIINMFSELARPYRQYGRHYYQVSAWIQSPPLPQGYEAYRLSLLALPMQRLRDYQDLIGSIVQVTESFNPDRLALLSAKSLLEHTLKMIETFSVEDEGHFDPTGMVQPDSPPDIGHAVKLAQQYMIANGGFGSVYQGMYSDGITRQAVAIKIFIKREIIDDAKFQKRLRREVKVWWRLQHPNVIPLLGISFDHGEYMSMISPWMEGGPLNSHLQKHASTLGIEEKLKFLNEIADGLQYLHNNRIVHGDLTTANILLDSKHNAVLSDFGISFLVDEFVGTSYMTTTIAGGGALRWAAPELVPTWEDTNFQPVKGYESDIYSLGGVLYHVLSGHVPFHDKKDMEIFNLVVQLRQHPERPPDDLITNSCWNFIAKYVVENGSWNYVHFVFKMAGLWNLEDTNHNRVRVGDSGKSTKDEHIKIATQQCPKHRDTPVASFSGNGTPVIVTIA